METLDGWFIGRCEAFAHWWQRLTGLTNFWLARVIDVVVTMLFLPATILIVLLGNVIKDGNARLLFLLVLAVMLYSQLNTSRTLCSSYRDVEAYYLDGATAMHPMTRLLRALWTLRFSSLLFALSLIAMSFLPHYAVARPVFVVTALAHIASLVEISLACVVPLPPGVSKVRKLVDNWTPRWRALATTPS